MVAEHGRHRGLHLVRFVVAVDLPQVARRGVERGGVFGLHLHAVVRDVVDAALTVFGDRGEDDIRAAVHVVVAHHRQLEEVDVFPRLDDLFYRRLLGVDDRRRDPALFALEADLGHLRPARLLRHAERDLGFALRDLAVHHELEVAARLAVQVQGFVEDENGEFLLRAEVLDDRGHVVMGGIDFLADVHDLVRDLAPAILQKSAQALGHEIPPGTSEKMLTTFLHPVSAQSQ